jgi:hypothetical protein
MRRPPASPEAADAIDRKNAAPGVSAGDGRHYKATQLPAAI